MPQIGPLEVMVVAVVALIVFGPEKLPELARTIGRYASEMRRVATEVRSEFEFGLDDEDDTPAKPSETRARAPDEPEDSPDDAPSDAGPDPAPIARGLTSDESSGNGHRPDGSETS